MGLLSKNLVTTWSSLYLVLCATNLFCYPQFTSAGNNETDRLALLHFKAKLTNDPLGVMNSWNDTIHFCEWQGVTCGRQHQRVTTLKLPSSELTGSISPYIGNLSFLKELYLHNNSFSGTIPQEIGRLHRLQYLVLYNNSIGGDIPLNISQCSSLVMLHLYNNRLVGGIPPEISLLKHLQVIRLSVNNLVGTIPSSLGNLSSLYDLSLANNGLFGTIPESLGYLKNLSTLLLGYNNLHGLVPSSIYNTSSLEALDLSSNQFEGSLPSYLGNSLPKLQVFNIDLNKFTGSIPTSVSNWSNIEFLSMGYNNLRGQVPPLQKLSKLQVLLLYHNFLGNGEASDFDFVSSLGNATMLRSFEISINNFTGTFPEAICNFSILSDLQVGALNLYGQLPSCIENMVQLEVFVASYNKLSGSIPWSITKLQNLNILDISDNQLSGPIPPFIGNISMLNLLDLSQNNLEGHIPSSLGNCMYLQQVNLSMNHLSGRIPSEILSLPTLSFFLDLSGNHLNGILPDEVGKLTNLGMLDISKNSLSGQIPSALSECVMLEYLYLGKNAFRGEIPSSLTALKGLRELDLSRNNLSGQIPKFLENLELQILNLSSNNFEGEVPTDGVFSNRSGFSVLGNTKVCGGLPAFNLPQCHFTGTKKQRPHNRKKFVIALVFVVVGAVLLVTVASVYALKFKKKRKEQTASELFGNTLENLSYQSLLKATNGFSSDNLLGSGTFGAVYMGILDQNRRVAIKVFDLTQHGASKSFMAECGMLKNIRHRNLLKVITACSGIDHQGKDFKALIYEYMSNGSLDDWLHSGLSTETENLSLYQRFNITVHVAFALEYLHHRCGASVVHCDLKPSNVLLDDGMVAHVGDFGLSKFLSNSISESRGSQSSSIGVKGTPGYVPQEYGLGHEVSTQGDVYSFGILVLEMFTCKRPTSEMFNGDMSLHCFVKDAIPDRVNEVLDPALLEEINSKSIGRNGSSEIMDHSKFIIWDGLISVLEIALCCSSEMPQQRPDISDVAGKLSGIRDKVLRTSL